MSKIIQIAIEQEPVEASGFTRTFLWALDDQGRIWVRVGGGWSQQEGPNLEQADDLE